MKVILNLIAIAFLVTIFVVVMVVLQFKYFGPWQHTRNTEKAEAFNQTNWETGFADIYTVEVAVKMNDEMRSVSMDVICARKITTIDVSLKDANTEIRDYVKNFSPREITLPISDDYRVVFEAQLSCAKLAEDLVGQEFPFSPLYYLTAKVQHTSEPSASCQVFLNEGKFQFETLQVFPITVVATRVERVSDVLSREDYGLADIALVRERERENPPPNDFNAQLENRYTWSNDSTCWGRWDAGKTHCLPLDDKICMPTL